MGEHDINRVEFDMLMVLIGVAVVAVGALGAIFIAYEFIIHIILKLIGAL